MEGKNILHMNTGNGELSYARNSLLQESMTRKALSVLNLAIKSMADLDIIFSQCVKIADLGCSSSVNSLLVASNIIDIVNKLCEENNQKAPQFEFYLNDLFGNDFNTIIKMIPNFYSKLKKDQGEHSGHCFVSATPGSFYGRLFPDQSMHLVHSSYCLHWLSQAPDGIENNTTNIYIAKSSPPNVFEAYEKQFQNDFGNFLKVRSQEIVQGGCMVLTFIGRSMADPTCDDCIYLWHLLGLSLLDLLKEGLIQESDLNSFNMPYYTPYEDEVMNIIRNEGSFSLDTLNVFQVNWYPIKTDDDDDDDDANAKDFNEPSHIYGKKTAKAIRAAVEPFLTSHFGNSIMDVLFKRYAKHVALHLAKKNTGHFSLVISLSKK
ncbi:unnamed protein product [Lactuca virosa]|uniref:Uncharacterized protein n=1 Tax=Lactuca virosa TaxID=75947 RepID=A0AAU9P2Y3_9ASTR|nr:unnamed protein product [Lactuca virosa]